MRYMLDTNICIYIIKKQPPTVFKKFATLDVGDIGISSVTLAELHYGVAKSKYQKCNCCALEEFILPLEISPFDEKAAFIYGNIRENLEQKGKLIGSMDLMIAAHASSLNVVLVTNNTKEFKRVTSLKIENWV